MITFDTAHPMNHCFADTKCGIEFGNVAKMPKLQIWYQIFPLCCMSFPFTADETIATALLQEHTTNMIALNRQHSYGMEIGFLSSMELVIRWLATCVLTPSV